MARSCISRPPGRYVACSRLLRVMVEDLKTEAIRLQLFARLLTDHARRGKMQQLDATICTMLA